MEEIIKELKLIKNIISNSWIQNQTATDVNDQATAINNPMAVKFSLEGAILKVSSQPTELINLICESLNISIFDLDTWNDDPNRTNTDIINNIDSILSKLEKRESIDHLNEILSEIKERGFVYLSPTFIRLAWELGKELETKKFDKIESILSDLIKTSAGWYSASIKERIIENQELTQIRPIPF